MAQLRLRHDAVIAFSQNGDDLRLNDWSFDSEIVFLTK